MLVWDFVDGVTPGVAEPVCTIHWHVGGTCEMNGDVSEVCIDERIVCRIRSAHGKTLVYGRTNPSEGGWHSSVYGRKEPAYTLNIRGQGISSDGVSTIFDFNSDKFLSVSDYEQDLLELRHEVKKFRENS